MDEVDALARPDDGRFHIALARGRRIAGVFRIELGGKLRLLAMPAPREVIGQCPAGEGLRPVDLAYRVEDRGPQRVVTMPLDQPLLGGREAQRFFRGEESRADENA